MTTSFKDTEAFVDNAIEWQRDMDERTRVMAKEIVDGQDLKTLEEAKRFAQNWIQTAAQHSRNEAYWETRARDAEALLRRCIDKDEGLLSLGSQVEDVYGEKEIELAAKIDILLGDVRAALGDK
jgi:hypothetical protein